MVKISQRKANGLASRKKFRSKVDPVIAKLDKEVKLYLSGAGPTRTRPRVSVCAIASRANVARTTFRAPYHKRVRDRIRKLKEKLQGRATFAKAKAPTVIKRTERPKQQDLLDQLASVSQKLRESERRNHAMTRQYKSQQDLATMVGELNDAQIVELVTLALARRGAVRVD
jgi:hypothetical protein